MAYWLMKSEPSAWSWDQQVQAGAKGTHWDGVRNHLAKNHMIAMKKGDLATALLHFKEAARINPRNSSAQTGTGLAQMGLGNREAAHDAFAAALSIDIHDVTSIYHLVKCAYELKKFDVVAALLEKYIKHNAVNANILYSYAGIQYHRGMLPKALEECEKLLTLKADHEGAKKLRELILGKLQR